MFSKKPLLDSKAPTSLSYGAAEYNESPVAQIVENTAARDFMKGLPSALLAQLATYLTPAELYFLSLQSKELRALAHVDVTTRKKTYKLVKIKHHHDINFSPLQSLRNVLKEAQDRLHERNFTAIAATLKTTYESLVELEVKIPQLVKIQPKNLAAYFQKLGTQLPNPDKLWIPTTQTWVANIPENYELLTTAERERQEKDNKASVKVVYHQMLTATNKFLDLYDKKWEQEFKVYLLPAKPGQQNMYTIALYIENDKIKYISKDMRGSHAGEILVGTHADSLSSEEFISLYNKITREAGPDPVELSDVVSEAYKLVVHQGHASLISLDLGKSYKECVETFTQKIQEANYKINATLESISVEKARHENAKATADENALFELYSKELQKFLRWIEKIYNLVSSEHTEISENISYAIKIQQSMHDAKLFNELNTFRYKIPYKFNLNEIADIDSQKSIAEDVVESFQTGDYLRGCNIYLPAILCPTLALTTSCLALTCFFSTGSLSTLYVGAGVIGGKSLLCCAKPVANACRSLAYPNTADSKKAELYRLARMISNHLYAASEIRNKHNPLIYDRDMLPARNPHSMFGKLFTDATKDVGEAVVVRPPVYGK